MTFIAKFVTSSLVPCKDFWFSLSMFRDINGREWDLV